MGKIRLRKYLTFSFRANRLREAIRAEHKAAMLEIEHAKLKALQEINREMKVLNDEREKFLNETIAIIQTEAGIVREITGKDFQKTLDRIKAILNIEQANINQINANPNPNDTTTKQRPGTHRGTQTPPDD